MQGPDSSLTHYQDRALWPQGSFISRKTSAGNGWLFPVHLKIQNGEGESIVSLFPDLEAKKIFSQRLFFSQAGVTFGPKAQWARDSQDHFLMLFCSQLIVF